MSSINHGILNELKMNHELPDDMMQLVENKFKSVNSLFTGLATAYQQQRYFREEFHKIVSTNMQKLSAYICTFLIRSMGLTAILMSVTGCLSPL